MDNEWMEGEVEKLLDQIKDRDLEYQLAFSAGILATVEIVNRINKKLQEEGEENGR